jgi:proprotein convertase subtilisin/kexin type 5
LNPEDYLCYPMSGYKCPASFYLDTVLGQCSPCQDGCNNCTSSHDCSECMSSYFRYEDVMNHTSGCSYLSCPAYFRIDMDSGKCIECPPGCLSCLEDNTCESCDQNYTMYWGSCINYCPNGTYNYNNDYISPFSSSYYYYIPNYLDCVECQDGCLDCLSYSTCNMCEPGSYKKVVSNKSGVTDHEI